MCLRVVSCCHHILTEVFFLCLYLFNLEEEWVRAEQPVSMVIEQINILLAASLKLVWDRSTFEIIGHMGCIPDFQMLVVTARFLPSAVSKKHTFPPLVGPGFVPSPPAQCVSFARLGGQSEWWKRVSCCRSFCGQIRWLQCRGGGGREESEKQKVFTTLLANPSKSCGRAMMEDSWSFSKWIMLLSICFIVCVCLLKPVQTS